MRIKIIFIFVLLFSLVLGCSADRENNTAVGKESSEISNVPGIDQIDTDDENTGVITDTIVDVFMESDTKSERVTQAIFNQPAKILEEEESWVKVKAVDGCTGWIKSKYIDRDCSSLKVKGCKYRVVVISKKAKVLSEAQNGAVLKEVVMGTEFYPINSIDGWYGVVLPGNEIGWLSESGTIQIPINKHIFRTKAEDFVATAMKFKGSVYLWGGVSAWGGIDCSGLTYISSRINGVDLPRVADQQFNYGKAVDKKSNNLLPGDLIFFSSNEDLKDISDIGVYMGDSQFIHASKSEGTVTIGSMGDSFFKKRLVGIRRIF